jgi:hypothetical protein
MKKLKSKYYYQMGSLIGKFEQTDETVASFNAIFKSHAIDFLPTDAVISIGEPIAIGGYMRKIIAEDGQEYQHDLSPKERYIDQSKIPLEEEHVLNILSTKQLDI